MDNMIIPLNDWAAGERQYRFHAGLEFFQTFDNSEILDADVNVEVLVAKEGMRRVEADLHLSGTVTVPRKRRSAVTLCAPAFATFTSTATSASRISVLSNV